MQANLGNSNWAHSSLLGLSGELETDGDRYVFFLNQGNIMLGTNVDKLIWSYNSIDGSVSASLDYRSLFSDELTNRAVWWTNWMWKIHLPLKIKFFLLLCLNNKVLSQDNIQKKVTLDQVDAFYVSLI